MLGGVVLASGLSRLIDRLKASPPAHVPHGTEVGPEGFAGPVDPDPTKPTQLRVQRVKPFGVVSAFKDHLTKSANLRRSGDLLRQINALLDKPGAYKLVGTYADVSEEAVQQGLTYQQAADRGMLNPPSVEESYLVIKPEAVDQQTFESAIVSLGAEWNQTGVLVGDGQAVWHISPQDGTRFSVGTGLTVGLMTKAYSRMRNKPNVPFVFAGTLTPDSGIGAQLFWASGLSHVTRLPGDPGTAYSDLIGRHVMAEFSESQRSS